MPSARIHHVWIPGINGDRLDVLDFRVIGGRNLFEGLSAVAAAKHPVQSTGHEHLRIGSRHGQGANRLVVHGRESLPALTTIPAAKQIASLLALRAPRRHVHHLGIPRVDHDVVQHVVFVAAQMG